MGFCSGGLTDVCRDVLCRYSQDRILKKTVLLEDLEEGAEERTVWTEQLKKVPL